MQHNYFVYEGMEVIKTGRIASRESQTKSYNGTKSKIETVVEITPIPSIDSPSWRKWVSESELFTITDVSDDVSIVVDSQLESIKEPNDNPIDKILDSLRKQNTDGTS